MSTRNITLRWRDANMIEKGYKVYRSKTPMDIFNMPPPPIATLESNATEFIDTDQIIGDTNYYIVSAYIDDKEEFSGEISILISSIPEPTLSYMSTMTDSSYASIGFNPLLEGNSTISLWVYPKNMSGGAITARQTIYSGVGPTWNTGAWANLDVFRVHINGEYIDYSPLTNNQWYHITILYGSTTIDGVYIDGVSVTPTGVTKPYSQSTPSYYIIGAEDDNGSKLWEGHIKDFFVYDYPLSTNEIIDLYNNNNKPF